MKREKNHLDERLLNLEISFQELEQEYLRPFLSDQLELLDPKLSQALNNVGELLDIFHLQTIVDMTLWSFNIEIQLGYSVFSGLEQIASANADDLIETFVENVKKYVGKGTSLGILTAEQLPIILLQRHSELLTQFFFTLDTLYDIGLYILHRPLKSFKKVLESGDLDGAMAMLDLFTASFSKDLDFHQSKNLTQYLPKICESLSPKTRAFQIRQLTRIARINVQWIYACENGFNSGLQSLRSHALETFVQTGIDKYQSQPEKGMLFFAIASEMGKNVFESLQTVYPLQAIHDKLTQYIHARIGYFVSIRSVSQLPKQYQSTDAFLIYNDGLCIYLPDEISLFSHKKYNRLTYKYLIRWEASFFEWGTYDLDLEKLIDMYPDSDLHHTSKQGTDIVRFLNSFSNVFLAKNLFILFEHARIRFCIKRYYPGILSTSLPVFQSLIKKENNQNSSVLQQIYNEIVLDIQAHDYLDILCDQIHQAIKHLDNQTATVETSARLTLEFYAKAYNNLDNYDLKTPFHNIHFELIEQCIGKLDQKAMKISSALRKKKIKIYKSDIRKQLYQKNELQANDLQELIVSKTDSHLLNQCLISLSEIENNRDILSDSHEAGTIFHYDEWDPEICGYKINYTRVVQTEYPQESNTRYDRSLQAHSGLLRHIRRRFEMIRPEGLKMLRRWQEGDAFDYRQLLQYGIDRKMQKTPSDRLYTKRVKEYRDVAVFLLVDLSRSTANIVPGSQKTVLDVEQDAIVIFCEALKQCCDPFAIAGFSSVGRHAVSFYRIKQMDENLTDQVKYKIGNMRSLRSTRMGAAIRHVNFLFEKYLSKIRLVIILSDGFPNDSDYKNDYAIKDTRQAIHEAHSKGIYIHGITVNLSENAKLDDLYGKGNYHVISDVTELPDRLPIIYHQLTKM